MSRPPVIRRGRIKVDAQKAVAKLRDHLLLDPDTWPLEVVRVAIMGGATAISVEHDADDLRVRWDGSPLPPASVARLLDFALESGRDPQVRRLKLLAIAVNASLSTRPSRVEVLARQDDGALRVTFDPAFHARVDTSEQEDERARAAQSSAVPLESLHGGAAQVWLRKGFGWGTFVRFATRRALREVHLLAAATRHTKIPIRFVPPVPTARATEPVLLVDLEPHGIPGGLLEVRDDGGAAPARAVFLEHGVQLCEAAWSSQDTLRMEGAGIHLPIELRFDAPSWPTNASRSQVDEREARRLLDATREVLPAVAMALDALQRGERPSLAGTLFESPRAAAAERALSAFACCASSSEEGGPLDFVLDLPLPRDAVGRPFTVRHLMQWVRRAADSVGEERLYVHRGPEALPPAFAGHADEVPWLRGLPTDALLAAVHLHDFAEVHEEVASGIERRAALHTLPEAEPFVPASRRELLRVRFAESSGPLAGLEGELVLHLRPRERPLLRIFLDDRPFATVHPDVVLPIDAALRWPGKLRATLRFDAIVEDAALEAAVGAVLDRAAQELGARADQLAASDAPEEARALARGALASSAEARRGPLQRAPLWPTASGAGVSLATLEAALESGALPFVQHAPEQPTEAPDRRIVPILDGTDAVRLVAALGRPIVLVPYGPALAHAPEERSTRTAAAHRRLLRRELEAQGVTDTVLTPFDLGRVRGLVATAKHGRVVRTHAGVALARSEATLGLPVVIVVEEDAILPSPGWDDVLSPPEELGKVALVEGALGRLVPRVVAEVGGKASGEPGAGDLGDEGSSLVPTARDWALAALSAVMRNSGELPGWSKALLDLPIATALDAEGMPIAVTAASVRARHGKGPVPFLREPPGFATMGWFPLLVERRELRGSLEAAVGLSLDDATRQLPRREDLARLEAARRALFARTRMPLEAPVPGAWPGSPVAEEASSRGKQDVHALVALRDPLWSGRRVSVRFSQRPVTEVDLEGAPPWVVAIVDLGLSMHLDRWAAVSASGRAAAADAVRRGSLRLAMDLLEAAEGAPIGEGALAKPCALSLVTSLLGDAQLAARVRTSGAQLPTAFGGWVTLAEAVRGERPIPVARRRFEAELSSRVVEPPVLLDDRSAELEALLLTLGPSLDDVTGPLLRAASPADLPATTLDGAAPHPALRSSVAALGATLLEGELELTEEPTSTIRVLLHDGSVRTLAPDLPFAVRGLVRPVRIDTRPKALRDVAEALAAASWKLLDGLLPKLDELPPLARDAARRTVLHAAGRAQPPRRELAEAPVFADATGRHHALSGFSGRKLRYTLDPAPYPASALGNKRVAAVLVLDAPTVAALRKAKVRLVDVTVELRRDLDAEARAKAPPVDARVPDEVRARSLTLGPVEAPRVGEVAVLAGDQWEHAGILVLKHGRPVCTLPPADGWPMAAVIEDARLKVNRRRDALAPAAQAGPLTEALAEQRDALLRGLLRADPASALATLDLDQTTRGLKITGRLWLLPDGHAEAGATSVLWAGRAPNEARDGAIRVDLQAPAPVAAGYPARVPVGGDLFVVPSGRLDPLDARQAASLGRLAVECLPALLATAAFPSEHAEGRASWAAALLGAAVKGPTARDAGGRARPAAAIVAELRRRGVLWVTRHAGMAIGDFPDEAPAFVLLDDGCSPLLALLDEHAPSLVREVGGLPTEAAEDASRVEVAAPTRAPTGAPTRPGGRRKGGRRRARTSEPAHASEAGRSPPGGAAARETTAPSTPEPAGHSWLSRLGTAVSDVVRGGPRRVLEAGDPLRDALVDGARRLGLADAPAVIAMPRGRPVRWDEAECAFLVALEHPTTRALLDAGELSLLVATAIGELNRARPAVSDAEEARAVADLLAARAERR